MLPQVVCSSHLRSAVMKYSPLFSALSIVSAAQVVLHLAQLQLHMLSQDIAAATQVLSTCTALMVHLAQGPQQQPLYSQLQLHFCILRVVVMIHEGQYVDLLKTGILVCHSWKLCSVAWLHGVSVPDLLTLLLLSLFFIEVTIACRCL